MLSGIDALNRDSQPENALLPILVTIFPSIISGI
jgi:hypothetical protein